MMSRRLVTCWTLACLLGCGTAAFAQTAVIPAGHEADVLRLIHPYSHQGPVTPGTRLTGIAIEARRIVLRVATPSESAQVVLTLQQQAGAAPTLVASAAPTASLARREPQNPQLAAIAANDDGRAFALAPPPKPLPPQPTVFAWPPPLAWRAQLGALLWLVLLVALLGRRLPADQPKSRAYAGMALSLLFVVLAFQVRRSAPFFPLHGGHAAHDAALALRLPGVVTEQELAYGASWVLAQQAGTWLFGQHLDGLGATSAALGALATGFGFGAAWTLGRSLPFAVLAGLLLTYAPAATRVGHSASTAVVAQYLIAAACWLALGRTSKLQVVGLAAALALLATGHPIAPGYALATLLLVLALLPPLAGLPKAWLIGSGLALLGAVASSLALSHDLLQSKLGTAAVAHLPPLRSLWFSADWAPQALWPLALLGLGALALDAQGRFSWRNIGFLTAGLGLLAVTGLWLHAWLSDGLRYQSAWAAPIALLVGAAPRLWQGRSSRLWLGLRAGALCCAALCLLALLRPMAGATVLDAHGQAWRALRERFAHEPGQLNFLVVHPLGPPIGRWSQQGPEATHMSADLAQAFCQRYGHLPANTWIGFEASCLAAPGACQPLERFAAVAVARIATPPLPRRPGQPEQGEFQPLPANAELRLVRARCPAPGSR